MPRGRAPSDREKLDRLLDVPAGGIISRLRASSSGRVAVCVDGASVCTLARDAVESLGLRKGMRWTPELALRLRAALEEDLARQAAGRLLAVRMRSKGELLDRLKRRGVKQGAATRLVDDLERRGGVDDVRFADAMARSIVRGKPAGERLIRASLRRKHVDDETASRAAKKALAGRDPAQDAAQLVAKRLRGMPPSLDRATKERRLLGALARRGFDARIARQAVREALGGS